METHELFAVFIFHQVSEANTKGPGDQNYSDDETISVIQLCRKFRVKDLKNKVFKVSSAKQIDVEASIKKIAKSVARETERSRFASVAISDADVPGGDLICHCLTTMDDLSGVAITNNAYGALFAKKLLNQVLLDFRDFFSFNPSMYIDMREDNPDFDTSLEPPSLDEVFELW